ncbi:hypothetical protein PMM47T1_03129 [Pseudomonas sp. M47T1]|nr:hypothetical protein PMM47T1_03129 [Pseudomonas sp. M47T1]
MKIIYGIYYLAIRTNFCLPHWPFITVDHTDIHFKQIHQLKIFIHIRLHDFMIEVVSKMVSNFIYML